MAVTPIIHLDYTNESNSKTQILTYTFRLAENGVVVNVNGKEYGYDGTASQIKTKLLADIDLDLLIDTN